MPPRGPRYSESSPPPGGAGAPASSLGHNAYPSYDVGAPPVAPPLAPSHSSSSSCYHRHLPSFHRHAAEPSLPAYPPASRPSMDHNGDPFDPRASEDYGAPRRPSEAAEYAAMPPPPPANGEDVDDGAGEVPYHAAPRDGRYGYAPASAFDEDGHHIGTGSIVHGGHGGRMSVGGQYDDDDYYAAGGAEDDETYEAHANGRANGGGGFRTRKASDTGSLMPGGFVQASDMEDGALGAGVRYGRIPQRVPRRYKTLKRVELYHGNLVLDCPVPSKLLERLNDRESREFTHMRYTAATCDPNDFKDERYTLRQVLFDPPRRTELFIVLTMYNEDEKLFTRTMHGVMANIAHLCSRERSKTWGRDGWKKVVVCIVSDGRLKINSRTLSCLAAMGVYQDGVAKNVVNGKQVTAHIYEYTTQLSIDPSLNFRGREKGIMPVQVLFCLKERNQKKINSHRWFFNAFGPILQPNVCVLLDVGTMPRSKSIYHLWKAFDINSNVAGACGEIVALKGRFGQLLFNPLVAAQNFEYKMSNILDKPLESVFGYISVLPGAFSAYRYIALQNDSVGQGPLASYFKGETLHGGTSDADIFTSNMYLAEDRILCWELVAKRDASWVLHYVKSAKATTDTPDTLPELISQRRRWLNGSLFAAMYSLVHVFQIFRTSHSGMRKLFFLVESFYSLVNLLFTWFAVANYFIAFAVLATALGDAIPALRTPGIVLQYVYLVLVIFCFILALGNRPAGSRWSYTIAVTIFALLTAYTSFAAIMLAIKSIQAAETRGADQLLHDRTFIGVVVALAATYGLYLIASALWLDPWHCFTSIVQYLALSGTFTNVIPIYAMANVHDVSWGTKGSTSVATDLGVVKTGAGGNHVDIALPTDVRDLDAAYDDALAEIGKPAAKPDSTNKSKSGADAEQKQKDYYATIRTHVLMVWCISNIALAVAILNLSSTSTKLIYMAVILYSVAVLAAVRLVGTVVYLVTRLFAGE